MMMQVQPRRPRASVTATSVAGLFAAVLVLLAGGVLGALAGSLIGGVMIGRRAHEAEAEFADLRAHARQEPPVAPAAGPAPMPVEPGETVFADEPRS